MQRHSGASDSLAPPPSPYPATVDPSPVDSVNSTSTDATDATDIEEGQSEVEEDARSPDIEVLSPSEALPHPSVRLDTESASQVPATADDTPPSVIHAPKGFKGFAHSLPTHAENPNSPDTHAPSVTRRSPELSSRRSTSSPSSQSEHTITSRVSSEHSLHDQGGKDTAPINTQVPPARHGAGSTPRASTQEEAEAEWKRRRGSRHSKNLSDGSEPSQASSTLAESETDEATSIANALQSLSSQETEIASLKAALSDCWTLCNTLAKMSSSHRQRMFSFTGSGEIQEKAWQSCWKLCQKLYDTRDEELGAQLKPTLDLCRDFCHALFDVRVKGDEVTDSILRVSFELNNHLYNIQDRTLPDQFTERTLQFYLTMCHRLMKQRTSLPEESDYLLRACWTLAELLFNMREQNREGAAVDDEVLSSAVQACWDLCDLFRESWTQVRPDRGTPRPNQTRFPGAYSTASSYAGSRVGSSRPPSALSLVEQNLPSAQERRARQQIVPETPTTIFDDRDDAASPTEPNMPNILVLGPEHPAMQTRNVPSSRWPSSASQSGYSEATRTTESSRTVGAQQAQQAQTPRAIESSQTSPKSQVSVAPGEDQEMVHIKALIVKAAQNKGYPRNSTNTPALPSFIAGLPPNAFGTLPWQIALYEKYKKLVLSDPSLRDPNQLPLGRRFSALKMADAVIKFCKNEPFQWFHHLFTWTFEFNPEEAGQFNAGFVQT